MWYMFRPPRDDDDEAPAPAWTDTHPEEAAYDLILGLRFKAGQLPIIRRDSSSR